MHVPFSRVLVVNLLRRFRFLIGHVALLEPSLPTLDRLLVAAASAVARVHERAVGEPRPPHVSAGAPVAQRAIHERHRVAPLERGARNSAADQGGGTLALEALERLCV